MRSCSFLYSFVEHSYRLGSGPSAETSLITMTRKMIIEFGKWRWVSEWHAASRRKKKRRNELADAIFRLSGSKSGRFRLRLRCRAVSAEFQVWWRPSAKFQLKMFCLLVPVHMNKYAFGLSTIPTQAQTGTRTTKWNESHRVSLNQFQLRLAILQTSVCVCL